MADENTVYILSGCRTPIGSLGGVFKNTPAHELGSCVIKEALERATLRPEDVNEVIMGQVLTGGQGPNPARLASLEAGIPNSVPAFTVNMVCGSGLKAVYLAYQMIKCGEASIIVAGGQESMSMAHHSACLRTGVKYGHSHFTDNILIDGLVDPTLHMHMGDTAEYLAQSRHISRKRQDDYAFKSQRKAADAIESTHFFEEIAPAQAVTREGHDTVYGDEFPKPETTMEGLAKLRPVFRGTTERSVTAGNSSGINDGAAAVVICSAAEMKKRCVAPFAKIVAFGQHGLAPEDMGLGPVGAIRNVLKKADWILYDVDLFELNEAFAVQAILVAKDLQIPEEKINISGGAIALGHPIGCSGTRVLVTLMYNLRRMKKTKGIAALCIGGGMGIAIAIEICY